MYQLKRPVYRVKRSVLKSPHVDLSFIGENTFMPVVLSQKKMPFDPSKTLFLAVHTDKIGLALPFSFRTSALKHGLHTLEDHLESHISKIAPHNSSAIGTTVAKIPLNVVHILRVEFALYSSFWSRCFTKNLFSIARKYT
jgi:hypothetical protein